MRLDAASRRIGLILIVATLMVMLDLTVVTVALPHLTAEFDASLSTVQWVTTAYTLALIAVMPLSAWSSARFGARQVYGTALAVFVLGSFLAAVSWDIGSLIAFRAVQGLGGGMLQPVGMAIALQAVPESLRGRMMALLGVPVLIGPVVGPILGGALIDHASWRVVFALNVPLGLAALAFIRRHLPASKPQGATRIDIPSMLALSPGGAFVVFGLARAGDTGGLLESSILVPIGVGLMLLGWFAMRSLRSATPVLNLRLLATPQLRGGVVTLLFFSGAYFGSMIILPIYVQAVRGDDATTAGALYLLPAVVTGVTLQIATRLADRVGARRVAAVGITASLSAMITLASVLGSATPYPAVVGILTLLGFGVGATLMPTMTAATRTLEGPDTANGTTIMLTTSQLSNALVAAVVTAALAGFMNARSAAVRGNGVAGAMALDPAGRSAAADDLAGAVADTYLVAAGLMALALVAAIVLIPAHRRSSAVGGAGRPPAISDPPTVSGRPDGRSTLSRGRPAPGPATDGAASDSSTPGAAR
ncbi:DHA2 family efflux MFS transporter permease subunit [Gordonia soli]|uniref:Putative drug resistance transporter n=1 Tax=Gordonia soli NBRC 108243 TaxID=1223545 RepID=M0QJ43_9ACTN|nr:DHA2 family efflux MFS transporter permease subunit [Gordonia soli]GAC68650.1 putative drug resistance transporter [Gordonia soli NBRC 108243]